MRIVPLTILITAMLICSPLAIADETEDIPTNASNTGIHDSLVAALVQAELVATLEGDGPFTVFAPTDDAFDEAGIDLAALDNEAGKATLTDILLYHVYSGSVTSSDLTDGATETMVNGDDVTFTVGDTVMVNDATVVTPDVTASNGIIHVIDKVLTPPVDVYVGDGSMSEPYFEFFTDAEGTNVMTEIDISKNYKFQRLNNPSAHPFYIGDTGYNTASSDKIIIAGDGSSTSGISDDQSFTLFFRDSFTVEDTLEYYCTVHSSMIASFTLTEPVTLEDIPTVAASTGSHSSLVDAVVQAGLLETLQGDGPFTVFAPTDDAFDEAGIDLAALDNEAGKATLTDILLYHVYSGSVTSSDLTDGATETMVNGDDVTFTVGDTVMVNDATVVTPDVTASNGIIHVIDKVLMPPADETNSTQDEDSSDSTTEADTSECDVIIGIDSTGMAYDQVKVYIKVGDTVCWIWNDESMGHNVAQVDSETSTMLMANGVYSGEPQVTVDFRHTFTEDETFYYVCVPHVANNMKGEIIVGAGTVEDSSDDSNSTPGFGIGILMVALLAGLMFNKRKIEIE